MRQNKKGFTIVEILIVLVVLALIGVAGWFVYQRQNKTDEPKNAAVTNFEECKAAGYPVGESNPEQCFANGQTFVNDEQRIQMERENEEKFLEIPEFGVRLKLTEGLSDLFYVKTGEDFKLNFSLKSFKGLGGASCATDLVHSAALIQTTFEEAQKNPFIGGENRVSELVKVGDYYYHVPNGGSICSTEKSFMAKAQAFDSDFRSAVKNNLEPLN